MAWVVGSEGPSCGKKTSSEAMTEIIYSYSYDSRCLHHCFSHHHDHRRFRKVPCASCENSNFGSLLDDLHMAQGYSCQLDGPGRRIGGHQLGKSRVGGTPSPNGPGCGHACGWGPKGAGLSIMVDHGQASPGGRALGPTPAPNTNFSSGPSCHPYPNATSRNQGRGADGMDGALVPMQVEATTVVV